MTLFMRDKAEPTMLHEISEEDSSWLMDQLELADADAADFYIARDTVNALEAAGASSSLLASLYALLSERTDADVELVHLLTDGALARVVMRPHETVETTEDRPLVTCVVCGAGEFSHRRVPMPTPVASFLNVEWMGPNAQTYICTSCGFVHWFLK